MICFDVTLFCSRPGCDTFKRVCNSQAPLAHAQELLNAANLEGWEITIQNQQLASALCWKCVEKKGKR